MAGPSPAFLAQLNAGLQPTLDMPADTITPAGAKMAPPPAVYNAPTGGEWQPADPLAGIKPVNARGAGVLTGYDPLSGEAEQPVREPTSFTRGDGPGAAPNLGGTPTIQANPGDVEFAPVHVPGSPAREVPVRGPKQNELLDRSFKHPLGASEGVARRSVEQADRERAMYERQAEQFEEQQAAMMRVQARRQQELQQMRTHYMDTIDQLSNFQVDNNRLWNNSTTMDKIATLLLITMGAAGGGKESLTMKAMQKRIQDDVESQKFAYETGLNYAKGQQTAYAMAMDQYGSEDAAYHAALSAGQQAVAAKVAGMNAQWKGTDAQNKAQAIQGELLMQADQNKAAGLKYLQPTPGSTMFRMRVRGQDWAAPVTGAEANKIIETRGVAPAERLDEKGFEGGISLAGKRIEQAGKQADKTGDETKFIASKLQEAKVPELRADAERVVKWLNKSPGGTGEAFLRGATPGESAEWLLSEDRNAREQAWHKFENKAINVLSGANVPPNEMERLRKELGNASHPESRRRAAQSVLDSLDQVEKNILRGVSEEGERRYKSRGETASPGDPVAPKGVQAGWK